VFSPMCEWPVAAPLLEQILEDCGRESSTMDQGNESTEDCVHHYVNCSDSPTASQATIAALLVPEQKDGYDSIGYHFRVRKFRGELTSSVLSLLNIRRTYTSRLTIIRLSSYCTRRPVSRRHLIGLPHSPSLSPLLMHRALSVSIHDM